MSNTIISVREGVTYFFSRTNDFEPQVKLRYRNLWLYRFDAAGLGFRVKGYD